MKCMGGVNRILHPDSKGLGKCRKRVIGLRRRAQIGSVFRSINVEEARGSQAKSSALEVTWRAGSWVQIPGGWWWLGSHGMCQVVLMHSEMETLGTFWGGSSESAP